MYRNRGLFMGDCFVMSARNQRNRYRERGWCFWLLFFCISFVSDYYYFISINSTLFLVKLNWLISFGIKKSLQFEHRVAFKTLKSYRFACCFFRWQCRDSFYQRIWLMLYIQRTETQQNVNVTQTVFGLLLLDNIDKKILHNSFFYIFQSKIFIRAERAYRYVREFAKDIYILHLGILRYIKFQNRKWEK